MIDAAIFDMDGLMFDTQRLYDQMWEPACAEQGLPVIQGMVEDTRGTNGENMWAAIRKYYGEKVNPPKLWADNKKHTFAALEKHVPKRPGLDELLAWLAAHDVPMAVASSTEREHVLRNLEVAGVRDYFKVVIAGDMVTRSKPDPETFLVAARELGVEPARSLVLEDAYNGVRAGHAGGFITVMVPDVAAPNNEMHELANHICNSLLDVRDLLEADQL